MSPPPPLLSSPRGGFEVALILLLGDVCMYVYCVLNHAFSFIFIFIFCSHPLNVFDVPFGDSQKKIHQH